MPREHKKIGSIYLADISPEMRIKRIAPVMVVEEYPHHYRCRTVVMPGEYGMGSSYFISFAEDQLVNEIKSVRELKKWILQNNVYSGNCFSESNPMAEKNKAIQEDEYTRIADVRGEIYK